MVSNTKQSQTRRELRNKAAGQAGKKYRGKNGTPAFPVHPEGYDPKAPDARKS